MKLSVKDDIVFLTLSEAVSGVRIKIIMKTLSMYFSVVVVMKSVAKVKYNGRMLTNYPQEIGDNKIQTDKEK